MMLSPGAACGDRVCGARARRLAGERAVLAGAGLALAFAGPDNSEGMVSFSGGGGGGALAGPMGIVALLILAVIVIGAWWLFSR